MHPSSASGATQKDRQTTEIIIRPTTCFSVSWSTRHKVRVIPNSAYRRSKNDDGTARVFDFLNTGGISQPFDDPCPVPWTGPMPRPVGYYTLDDSGAPDQFKTWGDIPVPTKLTEIK